jgi:superfamily II DNA helicase RecQ
MLVGSKSAELEAGGLHTLSTFGLLREAGEDYTRDLFDMMEKAGMIATETSGEYPLLGITAEGEAVMRGERSMHLDWPGSEPSKPTPKRPSAEGKKPKSGALTGGKKRKFPGIPFGKKGSKGRGREW